MVHLDLEFHHGNGPQHHFYKEASMSYVTIREKMNTRIAQAPKKETGNEVRKGYNLNLPLNTYYSTEKYLERLHVAIKRNKVYNPKFLVVSLGFDTFRLDPLGAFGIDAEEYEVIARKIRGFEEVKGISTMIVIEDGYVVDKLDDNMLSFLKGLEGEK